MEQYAAIRMHNCEFFFLHVFGRWVAIVNIKPIMNPVPASSLADVQQSFTHSSHPFLAIQEQNEVQPGVFGAQCCFGSRANFRV
jgi:hypothetical protein